MRINKISTNSNGDCKDYWKQHSTQGASIVFALGQIDFN